MPRQLAPGKQTGLGPSTKGIGRAGTLTVLCLRSRTFPALMDEAIA